MSHQQKCGIKKGRTTNHKPLTNNNNKNHKQMIEKKKETAIDGRRSMRCIAKRHVQV